MKLLIQRLAAGHLGWTVDTKQAREALLGLELKCTGCGSVSAAFFVFGEYYCPNDRQARHWQTTHKSECSRADVDGETTCPESTSDSV